MSQLKFRDNIAMTKAMPALKKLFSATAEVRTALAVARTNMALLGSFVTTESLNEHKKAFALTDEALLALIDDCAGTATDFGIDIPAVDMREIDKQVKVTDKISTGQSPLQQLLDKLAVKTGTTPSTAPSAALPTNLHDIIESLKNKKTKPDEPTIPPGVT